MDEWWSLRNTQVFYINIEVCMPEWTNIYCKITPKKNESFCFAIAHRTIFRVDEARRLFKCNFSTSFPLLKRYVFRFWEFRGLTLGISRYIREYPGVSGNIKVYSGYSLNNLEKLRRDARKNTKKNGCCSDRCCLPLLTVSQEDAFICSCSCLLTFLFQLDKILNLLPLSMFPL